MHPLQQNLLNITRRHFFRECGVGVGKIALASLLSDAFAKAALGAAGAQGSAPANPLSPLSGHLRFCYAFLRGEPEWALFEPRSCA